MSSKTIKNQFFRQISSSNNVLADAFQGDILFNYQLSNCYHGTQKTYLQLRLSLTHTDGTPLQLSDNLAPSYLLPTTLFSNCYVYANNQLVDQTDNLTECEVLSIRQMASEPSIQNVLVNTMMSNFDFENRQNDVCSNGIVGARRLSNFEVMLAVPTGFFKSNSFIPCPSVGVNFEIRLTINPTYLKDAVQSSVLPSSTNYKLTVNQIYLYVHILEADIENGEYEDVLFESILLQKQDLRGSGKQNLQFNLDDTTEKITVAFQNTQCNSDPYYTTSLFIDPANRKELALKYMQLNYKNLNYPQTSQEQVFNTSTDYTMRYYYENLLQSSKLFLQGSALSLENFHESGVYYSQYVYNPNDVKSTGCQVMLDFGSTNVDDLRCLLFTHHTKRLSFNVSNNILSFK